MSKRDRDTAWDEANAREWEELISAPQNIGAGQDAKELSDFLRDERDSWEEQEGGTKLPLSPSPSCLGRLQGEDARHFSIQGGAFRLRHTFALRQLRRNEPRERVARWLGVVDPDVMARYLAVVDNSQQPV